MAPNERLPRCAVFAAAAVPPERRRFEGKVTVATYMSGATMVVDGGKLSAQP